MFTPIMQRAGADIVKVQEFYVARRGEEALLEVVAIEQGVARNCLSISSSMRRRSPSVCYLPQILRRLTR